MNDDPNRARVHQAVPQEMRERDLGDEYNTMAAFRQDLANRPRWFRLWHRVHAVRQELASLRLGCWLRGCDRIEIKMPGGYVNRSEVRQSWWWCRHCGTNPEDANRYYAGSLWQRVRERS
jgi:hypothetical protein